MFGIHTARDWLRSLREGRRRIISTGRILRLLQNPSSLAEHSGRVELEIELSELLMEALCGLEALDERAEVSNDCPRRAVRVDQVPTDSLVLDRHEVGWIVLGLVVDPQSMFRHSEVE